GSLGDKWICLPGRYVLEFHCRLMRLDYGPSQWKIVDNASDNGVFVNGRRVIDVELREGDVVDIGEYQLRYGVARIAPVQVPQEQCAKSQAADVGSERVVESQSSLGALATSISARGPTCPSCGG